MSNRRDGVIDRRSEIDRRRVYDIDYSSEGRIEKRNWKDRRNKVERRNNWMRVSMWSSEFVGDLSTLKIFAWGTLNNKDNFLSFAKVSIPDN
jgi:hypothetical protein